MLKTKYWWDNALAEEKQNAKADKGKPKLSLVPTEIINCIAKVREFGITKYKNPDNWKDVEKERYIDALYRHLLKYINDNNSIDEESGLPHLWHIACNLAFLCEFDKVERETAKINDDISKLNEKCNGKNCPMQYGYDIEHCKIIEDCPWYEERK